MSSDHMKNVPWKYDLNKDSIVDSKGIKIATILENGIGWFAALEDDNAIAVAHLVKAAPDLLATCEEFVRKVDCGEARSVKSYNQMKLAIARAKGVTE